MTTIDEMDEFFNFDEAAHQVHMPNSHLPSGPYDIDMAFAEQEQDEDSFTAIQHFSAAPDGEQIALALRDLQNGTTDTSMMSPGDFADFPRWIDGLYYPSKPCAYCRSMRIHCKIIKEGYRKGSCTSCVALARSCSLTFDSSREHWTANDDMWDLSKFDISANSSSRNSGVFPDHESLPGINGKIYTGIETPRPCEYCHNRGYQCKVIQEGERKGSCTSCVALEHGCSLATQEESHVLNMDDPLFPNPINSWMSTKVPDEESALFEHPKNSRSTPDLHPLTQPQEEAVEGGDTGPKVGARFSRESVRILRGWLSTHHRHPYPLEDEKESLQRQTGLNKTQITNWLANARRRGKVRAPRSTSPMPQSNYARGMDIPRRSTPALESMNPMERWKHSPPEHEPASITAISKAVTSSTLSSGHESPYSYGFSDDGSARSVANLSSTSSLGTSHSSTNSFASAFSHKSRGSFGSFSSFGNRGRRRRRRPATKPAKISNLIGPVRTFQCTFCTETFKTKHDWQRHEKSLHLSLERWVCCPNGPVTLNEELNHPACVYCGLANPPPGHVEVHNHSSCAERSLEERTFYRKDHLRQHLNLVHDAKFQSWSMDSWKIVTPEIRSRCGFCGVILDSWTIRVDHLAEHFKGGKSMADWKGDWGFEPQILEVVENGMPPYLIHDERNTTRPFEASKEQAEVYQKTPYDVIKIGLVDYINSKLVEGSVPTDEELIIEARKIFNNLAAFNDGEDFAVSWFNDLILCSGSPAQKERQKERSKFREAESSAAFKDKLRDPHMMIRNCPREATLKTYVDTRIALGLTPTDAELQIEACKILEQFEETSNYRCKEAVDWFKYLVKASTGWLEDFRRRAKLPRSSEMAFEDIRPADFTSIDSSIHTYGRIEREMTDYVQLQSTLGFVPTDKELQDKARFIIYGNDDPWNQTALDNPLYLQLFKRKYGLVPHDETDISMLSEMLPLGKPEQPTSTAKEYHSPQSLHWNLDQIAGSCLEKFSDIPLREIIQNQPSTNTNPTQPLRYFLNDANCYRRLVRELSRFVTSCMSVNNPNQHMPTDAELQNQARWVIYDDDDPWNQTAADNAEWLIRFKRDVGLAPAELGPGLPISNETWHHKQKGTGFAPPYTFPKEPPTPYEDESNVVVKMQEKEMRVKASTANKFLKSLTTRYPRVPAVFCSRELETGLNAYVKSEVSKGVCPTDAELQAKAREILGTSETAADDVQLLEKFKAMNGISGHANFADNYLPGFADPVFVGDISAEDSALLQQFDAELGSMDFTTDAMVTPESDGELQITDYASYHRVNTATASPLRRRASHIIACKAGYSAAPPDASSGNSPPMHNIMECSGPDSGAGCVRASGDFDFDFSLSNPDASTF